MSVELVPKVTLALDKSLGDGEKEKDTSAGSISKAVCLRISRSGRLVLNQRPPEPSSGKEVI
jgi:hypothetical protein